MKKIDIRLIGDTYTCTKVAGYEADEARATAKLKHVQTLKRGSTPGDVARQDLQTDARCSEEPAATMIITEEKSAGKMWCQ
jgi:hypothetical protein